VKCLEVFLISKSLAQKHNQNTCAARPFRFCGDLSRLRCGESSLQSRELNFVLGFPKFPSPLRTETQPDTHAQNHSRPLGAHDRSDSRFYVSSIGFAGGPGLVYGLSVPTVLSAVLHPSAIAALNAMGYSGTGLI
jgi:hypothetical protein